MGRNGWPEIIEEEGEKNEIVVTETHKGKTLVVNSIESYEAQGDVHNAKDEEITREEVQVKQKDLTSCARCLCKIFKVW